MMKRWVMIAVGVVVVVATIWFFVIRRPRGQADAAQAAARDAQRGVQVVAAPVAQKDLPIWLDGLGTVIANATITVRSQVDGRLDSVLFKEGQEVKRGQVLAQIDPRPFAVQLSQADGALHRDQAQLATARLTLERNKDLLKEKLVSQQDVDNAAAQVGQFEGAVRMDEAAVASAKLNLDYARIASPIDGVTGVRLVDAGNLVHANDQNGIVILTQLDPIAVLFTLPQDELPQVAQAMMSEPLTVEAWSRDGQTRLGVGRLALIDNQINTGTATMRLKATFGNPQHVLWPNQFVKTRLLVSTRKGALVVPTTALQRGPEGTFAYVVGPDQTVQPKLVEVDLVQGDTAAIGRGLSAGDNVVIDGAAGLRPGAKVVTRAPAQKQQQPSGRALGAER
jgi:multidrug efflux system membrane fusion protein